MSSTVLDRPSLNPATLARQLLLERVAMMLAFREPEMADAAVEIGVIGT